MKARKQPWNVGEVYAYKIRSELAVEYGLIGRYFLVQKIAESHISPRVASPIVYAKITKDEFLPTTTEEFDQLEFVQTWTTKYEDRFLPVDFSRLEEDIAEKAKLTYTVDEYGYLPQYRARLVLSAGKEIPPDMIYVGSFPDAQRPKIEFIPHTEFNIRMIYCKKDAESLDRILSSTYHGHNCRTFIFYQNTEPLQPNSIGLITDDKKDPIDCLPEWVRNTAKKLKELENFPERE